jgi:3-mercaptopyruvate sulfurtransferase SseA
MAGLLLDRKGFTRVRPLKGGIDAWRKNNYPMEAWAATVTSAEADISADPQTASENPTAIPGKQN